MAARNRVTPMGDIEAISLRGAWTGNRGILHSGREIVRFHATTSGSPALQIDDAALVQ